jgi:hypothetical protein
MLNPFFHNDSIVEQELLQGLINEAIQIYGIDVYYLPRFYLTKKKVIKEVIESEFTNAYPIEAYVETYEGHEGAGTLMTKFGIQAMTETTLTISRERFETYIAPLIKSLPNVELSTRPKEGDLIYFPLGDRIFEIKFVEHEDPFYQLGKTYTYKLSCELFRYQNEIIDTGIDIVDETIINEGHIQTYVMVGAGETASATATIVNGGVYSVAIINRGYGYSSVPSVSFGSAPDGGQTATGVAEMISGITDLCEPDPSKLRVQAVNIVNSGFGYTVAPSVAFTGGGGSGAEAKAFIGEGVVGSINIVNGGGGYVGVVTVSFVGITSAQAQGIAIVENGTITGVKMTNSGYGYTQPPSIVFSDPIFVGVGTYQFNETIVGSSSSITAKVRSWDSSNKILEVSNQSGIFTKGELITGTISGASYRVELSSYGISLSDPYADNIDIQEEADKLTDFTETNPFGML